MSITGNVIWLNAGSSGSSSLVGIHLESTANLVVSGNAIYGTGTHVSTFYGLQLASSCSTGQLGYNTYLGVGTAVLNSSIIPNHT